VRVWLCGVRGSTPSPGPEFAGVGGHTSCVALGPDDGPPTLVLDAGTGLRRLSGVLAPEPFRGTILLGHLHWDHTTGLPFFRAGDRDDAVVTVRLPAGQGDPEALLARSMSPPSFPITPSELRGAWRFAEIDEGEHVIEGFTVLSREIPHTGGRTFGYRISDGRHVVAYLSDHAPHLLGPGPHGIGVLHEAALALASGADILLHDAQYTAAELPARAAFGHSAADYAALLAERAGARRVLLFHHDPDRTDAEVHALAAAVAAAHPCARVAPALEGTVIEL
jgi:phosphoribosyl 1,2-cyclic phosphodiesterase